MPGKMFKHKLYAGKLKILSDYHADLTLDPENLSEFDDFNLAVAARLALERAPVVIRLVRLNADKPHRRAAFGTVRVFDFFRQLLDTRVLHPCPRVRRWLGFRSATP
jgi:hypothetical protein